MAGGAIALVLGASSVRAGESAAPPAPPATPAPPHAAPDSNRIRPDETVRRGTLANGLRYAVFRNVTPNQGVSVRLGIDVGSYEEADTELGVAHFVEHMAFNGTRNFAEDRLVDAFARRGVGFGRDLNASTELFATVYKLDLPLAEPEQVDTGFRWLRDVADGVLFTEEAVVRERGVVLAEAETRNTPSQAVQDALERFQAPTLRSVVRDPIGTPEVIKSMNGARLRGFYDRWYRPENAVVVVVGDMPVEVLEAKVRDSFANWTARGPKAPRVAPSAPDLQRGLDAFTRSEPNLPAAAGACRLRVADPRLPDDVAGLRRNIRGSIWRTIVEKRLRALRDRPEASVVGAGVVASDSGREALATCFWASPANGGWEPALQAIQAELRRFAEQGPTELEVEDAVEEIRSKVRGRVNDAPTRRSADLADDILSDALDGEVFAHPRETMRAFDAAVDDLTPADVSEAFRRDWAGAGPLLDVVGPDAPSRDRLQAAWRAGETGVALAKYVDRKAATWSYSDFGAAGRVTRRETFSAPEFVRLQFADGLVLNFKHTEFAKEKVEVRVRFGAGRRELDSKGYMSAVFGAGFLFEGGLAKHSADDLRRMFQNATWGVKLAVADQSFVLSGSATRGSLEKELQLLTAFMTDPGFRTSVDAVLPTALDTSYRMYRTVPSLVVEEALVRAVAPDSPYQLPPKDVFLAFRTADFEKALRPALTQAPIEVTIVGDIDEKAATDLVARTLGALPARKAERRDRADAWWLRFPDRPLEQPIRVTHEGSAEQALASLTWPLYVAEPARRREEYALGLLADVFTDELRRRVREELGKTYAPSAETSLPDASDQGAMTATVETRPEDLEAVVAEVRAVAERLKRGEITADQLEAARKPRLARSQAAEASNSWWSSALSGSARDPQILKDAVEYRALLSAVTLEEVKQAAATWLVRPPVVVMASPASKGEAK